MVDELALLGYPTALMQNDNEVSIRALRRKAAETTKTEVVPEDPPENDTQANGYIENANR